MHSIYSKRISFTDCPSPWLYSTPIGFPAAAAAIKKLQQASPYSKAEPNSKMLCLFDIDSFDLTLCDILFDILIPGIDIFALRRLLPPCDSRQG